LRKRCRRNYLDVGGRNEGRKEGRKGRREHCKKIAKLGMLWFLLLDKYS